jgi:hypothetical protein
VLGADAPIRARSLAVAEELDELLDVVDRALEARVVSCQAQARSPAQRSLAYRSGWSSRTKAQMTACAP